ncbi:hypothetical protein Acr_21g0002280 [Actinidia rufa]|uniref:Uncharacterized protein n=1 Tax=Actinidia rufa TaxID=165716 RepID=A0A7J0GFQ0_9ERIC|nr:hypothetical protein Acr_21g0002280 [Actinidia rufa]
MITKQKTQQKARPPRTSLDESSSAEEGLDACGNPENSSMEFEEGRQETIESKAEVSSREHEESMDLAQTETLTMECKREGVMAVIGKDDTMAEDQDQIETTNMRNTRTDN